MVLQTIVGHAGFISRRFLDVEVYAGRVTTARDLRGGPDIQLSHTFRVEVLRICLPGLPVPTFRSA